MWWGQRRLRSPARAGWQVMGRREGRREGRDRAEALRRSPTAVVVADGVGAPRRAVEAQTARRVVDAGVGAPRSAVEAQTARRSRGRAPHDAAKGQGHGTGPATGAPQHALGQRRLLGTAARARDQVVSIGIAPLVAAPRSCRARVLLRQRRRHRDWAAVIGHRWGEVRSRRAEGRRTRRRRLEGRSRDAERAARVVLLSVEQQAIDRAATPMPVRSARRGKLGRERSADLRSR
eukprot:scaffold5359_cov131-Isochrysis_galbana.AAC.6